jgi:prepilin-type N-terminal cleavage/methylation domain-containing protein
MAGKLNNKGLTLVELMIAMAIATIVIGSITYFMATSIKSYRKANDEITLQLEAQTILNQLNELIIEAYNVKMNEATDIISIYRGDMTYFIKLENNKLLLNKKQAGLGIATGDTWILFGEYITTFDVKDTGSSNDNSSILISFELNKNGATYEVSNSLIVLRNKIKPIIN